MLAKIKMYLSDRECENYSLSLHITPLLRGVLMSVIDSDYASALHMGGLNPYSMSFTKEDELWCWTVNTVGKEAYDKVITALLDDSFNSFVLEHKNNNVKIKITEKSLVIERLESITGISLFEDTSKIIKVCFETPTAFKRNGEYINYPDLFLIYHSLMKKGELLSEGVSFYDQEMLENLIENSKITSYNLRTVNFYFEGYKANGFIGSIAICVNGPVIMRSFVKSLLKIGTYLGVGIKSAYGMGKIKIIETKAGVKNE